MAYQAGDLVEINPFIEAPGFNGRFAVVIFADADKQRAIIRFPSGHTFWFMFSQLTRVSSVVQSDLNGNDSKDQ